MKYPILICLLCVLTYSCKNKEAKTSNLEEDKTALNNFAQVNPLENPSEVNSKLPRLFSNGSELYFSWVTVKDSMDVLNYSVWKGDRWEATTEIVRGSDWFTNWADFPAIAENNGNILTSYLQKSDAGTYTYDVKLNLYNAKTKTWKKNFILHNDGTKSEHGFVSMRPYTGDSFVITWLDGRETVGKGHGGGQMTIRAAIVFEDGSIDYDTLLDGRVCDCCGTTTAIGPNDEILVAYRDRSEGEIRDISVIDWTKELGWKPSRTIGDDHWNIAGCPVNGPSMDALGDSVGLAWFTAAKDEGDVNVAFSNDRGASFGSSFKVDTGSATGRVDLVMLSPMEAAVVWMQPEGKDEVILVMKVDALGNMGTPITISKTSAERASGFPQLERLGDSLYLAWTVAEEKSSKITTATIPISEL